MKILVMGGSSFVSKVVAMMGIKKGYQVDIFTRGNCPIDYKGLNKHIIGDRHNEDDLKKIRDSYDYVIDVTPYTKEDVEMLLDILDTSKIKRYIMCSTASVYINLKPGKIISEDHARGLDPKYPNDYGYNKYLAEEYLLKHELPVTIFRPTYIYGEYNNIYRDAYLFESIKSGEIQALYDHCHVQFIYVYDLAEAFYSSLDNSNAINKAYNLANEEKLDWTTWIKAGENAVGKSVEVKRLTDEEAFSNGQKFPFANIDLFFDMSALKDDGLAVPSTPFEDGISNAYKWYQTVGLDYITKRRF